MPIDRRSATRAGPEDSEPGRPPERAEVFEQPERLELGADSPRPSRPSSHDRASAESELDKLLAADRATEPRTLLGRSTEQAEPEVKEDAEATEITRQLDRLRREGHGPGRHLDLDGNATQRRLGTAAHDASGAVLYRASDGHVKKQPGTQIDPETGTPIDADTGKLHYCGPYATRFLNPADYVHADKVLRQRIVDTGRFNQEADMADLFPETDPNDRFSGFFQDPITPEDPGGHPRFRAVDFTGAKIRARYIEDDVGDPILKTLFPLPAEDRNPGDSP